MERILGLVRKLPRLIGSLAPTVITKMFMGIVSSVPLIRFLRTSHLFTHTRRTSPLIRFLRTSHLFTHTRRTSPLIRFLRTSHLFTHTRRTSPLIRFLRTSHLFTHTRRIAVELRPVVMELLRILKTEVERVHTMVVWLRGAVSFS